MRKKLAYPLLAYIMLARRLHCAFRDFLRELNSRKNSPISRVFNRSSCYNVFIKFYSVRIIFSVPHVHVIKHRKMCHALFIQQLLARLNDAKRDYAKVG